MRRRRRRRRRRKRRRRRRRNVERARGARHAAECRRGVGVDSRLATLHHVQRLAGRIRFGRGAGAYTR